MTYAEQWAAADESAQTSLLPFIEDFWNDRGPVDTRHFIEFSDGSEYCGEGPAYNLKP